MSIENHSQMGKKEQQSFSIYSGQKLGQIFTGVFIKISGS